jgi:hypothetical protein
MAGEEEERPVRPPPQPMGRVGPPIGYMMLIIIGLIIFLVGGIIGYSTGFMDDPDPVDYDTSNPDEQEDWDKDTEEYSDGIRSMNAIGRIVELLGLMILSLGLVLGAVRDERLPAHVRLGLLIALGLIFGIKFGGYFL